MVLPVASLNDAWVEIYGSFWIVFSKASFRWSGVAVGGIEEVSSFFIWTYACVLFGFSTGRCDGGGGNGVDVGGETICAGVSSLKVVICRRSLGEPSDDEEWRY